MFDPFMDELKSPQVLPPISDDGCTSVYRVTMKNGKPRLHSQLPADTPFLGQYPGPQSGSSLAMRDRVSHVRTFFTGA